MLLPLWHGCAQCGHLNGCTRPFPPSGVCPHPAEAAMVPSQPWPVLKGFDLPLDYEKALETDARFASIHERALRKIDIPRDDFFFLQRKAL